MYYTLYTRSRRLSFAVASSWWVRQICSAYLCGPLIGTIHCPLGIRVRQVTTISREVKWPLKRRVCAFANIRSLNDRGRCVHIQSNALLEHIKLSNTKKRALLSEHTCHFAFRAIIPHWHLLMKLRLLIGRRRALLNVREIQDRRRSWTDTHTCSSDRL